MRPGQRITAVFAAILVVCMAGSILVLGPLDRLRAASTIEETLYVPSPAVLKKLSLGYQGLMADIYWTRAVQYFGSNHHQQAMRYDLLYPLLEITTELDPKLLVAYQFGSIFLSQRPPEGAGQPDKAIQLVEHGISENPEDWKLYYNLGFIYYDMGAFEEASRAFARGAVVPGANPALTALAEMTAKKSGSSDASRLLWTKLYESSDNPAVRHSALQRLIALRIDEDVPQLEHIVHTFRERTGRYPSNFEEMVADGWLRSIPEDPTGQPYRLFPDGHVEVQSPEVKPYIHNGLPGNNPPASNSAEQNAAPASPEAVRGPQAPAAPESSPSHRRHRDRRTP